MHKQSTLYTALNAFINVTQDIDVNHSSFICIVCIQVKWMLEFVTEYDQQ